MDKNTQGRRRGVAQMLRDAKEEITALADFPEADWREVWSTNPLERLNREAPGALLCDDRAHPGKA